MYVFVSVLNAHTHISKRHFSMQTESVLDQTTVGLCLLSSVEIVAEVEKDTPAG